MRFVNHFYSGQRPELDKGPGYPWIPCEDPNRPRARGDAQQAQRRPSAVTHVRNRQTFVNLNEVKRFGYLSNGDGSNGKAWMGLESVEPERLGYAEFHGIPRAHRHETHRSAGSRQGVCGVDCLDCTGLFRWPFEIPGVKDSHV